ncbi:Ribosomal RNA large subunit methyltransferase E [Metarhizium album ARSEF 1941]|uniref:rRNA methyltransferase 2, mitochondrial n=1 Tax=Metarhizium album (strain ARSEF 1941) TaxID=1081103 RepID=A0A0B2WT74_METAS|nr:Ribosomal RNA large subunit methyltransferase E [Metarhizium album ARSEF 1941]KHN96170.1 Ribosomal RNA large subunit methyltransferase E [Metarhizium album ARSEF 1941]
MTTRLLLRIQSPLCSYSCRGSHLVAPTFTAKADIRWSSSNSRWKQRRAKDTFSREAKVQGLKSRAAFKLLEMDSKYRFFRPGQTVVDLVAQERTRPHGSVVGIDLIPAQPPRGVATFQGDFLSPGVQRLVKEFIARMGRPAERGQGEGEAISYIDRERRASEEREGNGTSALVDVVLSDMSAPWDRSSGYMANTLTNPYRRLMNTSGVAFRDHAGSMDLCAAALQFASDTLRPGGHFVCKFYQGGEDKKFEARLTRMFAKVFREKPESSRSESKEAYFVALRRRAGVVVDFQDAV